MTMHNIWILIFSYLLLVSGEEGVARDVTPDGPTNWLVTEVDSWTSPQNVTNYLFRGDLPLSSRGVFNYDILTRILESKVDLPEYYYIVDIACLRLTWTFWPDQPNWVPTEASFFENYTMLGEFMHWPLYGDIESPNDFKNAKSELEFYARTLPSWQKDQVKLPQRIELINKLLKTDYSTPRIFYVHCSSGIDRTGEFVIAYQITYKKKVFHEAMKEADALSYIVNGRPIFPLQAFSTLWYCWYMYYVKQFTYLDCTL